MLLASLRHAASTFHVRHSSIAVGSDRRVAHHDRRDSLLQRHRVVVAEMASAVDGIYDEALPAMLLPF